MAAGLARRTRGRGPAESFWHLFECLHANYCTMDGHKKSASRPQETATCMLLRTRTGSQGPLLGARRLVSGLFRWAPDEAGRFSHRARHFLERLCSKRVAPRPPRDLLHPPEVAASAQREPRRPRALISARRPVSGLFRWAPDKADRCAQRGRTADPDGSPFPPLPEATLIQTGCPAATVGRPAPTGSCRMCTAGASAASAGDRFSAPDGPVSMVPCNGRPSLSARARAALPGSSVRGPPFGAALSRAEWSGGGWGLHRARLSALHGPTSYQCCHIILST